MRACFRAAALEGLVFGVGVVGFLPLFFACFVKDLFGGLDLIGLIVHETMGDEITYNL